jgi:hypothetical protein
MTILKITVEDDQADLLKKLLKEVSFVRNIEQEQPVTEKKQIESSADRIKKILDEAKGRNLLKDIIDPFGWQCEQGRDMERDF